MSIWLRSEDRQDELCTPLMPEGARRLIAAGNHVTVEASPRRIFPVSQYRDAGCAIMPAESWHSAPRDTVILGLRAPPCGADPLRHRHVMFGRAYAGQPGGRRLMRRLCAGGGVLLDLDHLTDRGGRRLFAFRYWAGFAGAAAALIAWADQSRGGVCRALSPWAGCGAMIAETRRALQNTERPEVLILGARGHLGSGAAGLCAALGIGSVPWDRNDTLQDGPSPLVRRVGILLNCIPAGPGLPAFVDRDTLRDPNRILRVIGDLSGDPDSAGNPIRINDRTTGLDHPTRRLADAPPLDVMAIDNLPSLLPREASEDIAEQLLPLLLDLGTAGSSPWDATRDLFERHATAL